MRKWNTSLITKLLYPLVPAPCLLVEKSDKSPRCCIDFHKVNSVTKPDSYPLPQVKDCVDQVGTAKYVSKFDLLKGYCLFSYTVIGFRLRNAPATWMPVTLVQGPFSCRLIAKGWIDLLASSPKSSATTRSYSVVEKEALALILALRHFHVYLDSGMPIIVFTDHNPLTFLNSLQNSNQRLVQWALYLRPYNLNIRHIKGKDNVMADALPRSPS